MLSGGFCQQVGSKERDRVLLGWGRVEDTQLLVVGGQLKERSLTRPFSFVIDIGLATHCCSQLTFSPRFCCQALAEAQAKRMCAGCTASLAAAGRITSPLLQ